ncbi:hypothetical protein KM031_00660 [Gemmobacter fulvus]|uniref:Alpha 1,4-glycosyltransferase domain-containing protein n=1 Tax=Gemmobacter fulvus TaxID=2840474 RepID=A0A975S1M6_9RHOB|nr:hypothetical protein [Gemmobacter fulvus]MBT9245195.1 hypothetical protein [Gemmobacter fulvus]QWK90471.1 hypothetical protein KM031_00660 [Gemmobacter fulvus]
MARQREVGTLWIGGSLSWMEQLCLKSFVDQGQKITLFSYEEIPNVPEGVIRRDGREILDTDNFLKYEKKDSFALFADLFRLHMIRKCPGMIWIDTDVYCQQPMDYDSDYVLGFELPGRRRVNNAVLGLPADSPLLQALLEFTADQFAIPEFLKPEEREDYRAAAAKGQPVHVSQQPWGVWGPMMITHFVHKLGLLDKVQPLQAFYPVTFPNRMQFLRRAAVVDMSVTKATTALHVWASNKRELGLRHNGLPPADSWFDRACRKHGIRPEAAPIKGRGKRVFEAGLVDQVDLEQVGQFADVGGNAQSLALAAHLRWGCDIHLVDLDHKGQFSDRASAWVPQYTAFLREHGVDGARIHHVTRPADLSAYDLIANLSGFGDLNKVSHLDPVMTQCLTAETRMITDIRKGSGAYPFLNAYGACTTLSTREVDGVAVVRALFRSKAATALLPVHTDDWAQVAATLMGPDGFYRANDSHSFLYVPRGSDTLVVTFDNLDIAMTKREDRRPWGYSFIEKQGWSMLGVMANGWTWYRDPWVWDQFDDLATSDFFDRYKRVVFYGASMGGYAACAFAAACPGAEVLAISPQSTLDKSLVPWESRYKVAWDKDFSGYYGDAADVSRTARRVTILYDPYEPLDAGHVARFTHDNVMKLRTPLLGHRLGTSLQQMGLLSPITLGALNGTLTELEFYRMIRARKSFGRYQKELFKRAMDRGRPELAKKLGRWVLTRGDNRYIRKEMAAL